MTSLGLTSLFPMDSVEPVTIPLPLTPAELQILRGLARGLTRHEIAAERWVSMETVKSQTKDLRFKLNARTAAHCVARGFELGLL